MDRSYAEIIAGEEMVLVSREVQQGTGDSFAFHVLADWLGRVALDGSKMKMSLVKPVCRGDIVTARGRVVGKREADGQQLALCELRIENQDQELCIAMEAEVSF